MLCGTPLCQQLMFLWQLCYVFFRWQIILDQYSQLILPHCLCVFFLFLWTVQSQAHSLLVLLPFYKHLHFFALNFILILNLIIPALFCFAVLEKKMGSLHFCMTYLKVLFLYRFICSHFLLLFSSPLSPAFSFSLLFYAVSFSLNCFTPFVELVNFGSVSSHHISHFFPLFYIFRKHSWLPCTLLASSNIL